ncbi:hypothetical protein GCM10020219_058090 [Nonomuraea dietziae]
MPRRETLLSLETIVQWTGPPVRAPGGPETIGTKAFRTAASSRAGKARSLPPTFIEL